LTLVAQQFTETSRGVVSFRLHRVFEVHAGPMSRHEDFTLDGIYQDGAVVKVHVVNDVIDGKPASTEAQSALEQSSEHPKPSDVFAPPFDANNFSAYQYQIAGPQRIAFTSSVPDSGHGNGNFTYDSGNNVVSYTYQPNALPPHARWASVTEHRSEVLPGYWAVIEETQEYKGSYALFSGGATVECTYSNFRRFANLGDAIRSISAP
jgi:hypothetical protein